MGKDQKGKFRWIDGNVSLKSIYEARHQLKAKMMEIEKTGEKIFRQD